MWLEMAERKASGANAPPPERDASEESPDQVIDRLYRAESAALRLFVRRMVRNATDAEDIVQDSFMRVWRALANGGIQLPRAVLFETARNLALNHVRNSRVRNSDVARNALSDMFVRPIPTAEEQLIHSEESAGCQRLLEDLPARCREAFVLRVVEELSYKEMSKQMRLSISTIEKHVGKGKQICRSRIADARRSGDGLLASILREMPAEAPQTAYHIAAE